MSAGADRKEQILDTAEDLLRRYGLQKTGVVDVARALGLSHAAVYKYFPTKAALREAVTRRWLERISTPIARIAAEPGPAEVRLRSWFHRLVSLKRKKVLDDPELFATYEALAGLSDRAVRDHVAHLIEQLESIVADGVKAGVFHVKSPHRAAIALLSGTSAFHHPHFVKETARQIQQHDLDAVIDLLISGLKSGAV